MVRKLFVGLMATTLLLAPTFAAKGLKGKPAKASRAAATTNGGSTNLPARDIFAGLSEEERAVVLDMALKSSFVKSNLSGARYRVYGVEATAVKTPNGQRREAHTMILDIVKNKNYHVVNDITAGAPGTIIQTNTVDTFPAFTMEDYAEARELMMKVERVQKLMQQPNMGIQDGFPPIQSPIPGCNDYSHRCVEMQVGEYLPGGRNALFRLFVTVDLSTGQVVEMREPKTQTTSAR